jgi:AraC-like DNA-binding protein
VAALFVLLAIWAAYGLTDLVAPLGYSGLMGLYVAIAAFALFLGIEGWRHAALPFPHLAELEPPPAPATDWKAKAAGWAERVRTERLYADPELSVPLLARILGTNSAYVSRALNEGLGETFSAFIARLRCEEVAARLRAGEMSDLLDLALDCGFSSKASFNRAFLAVFGCTPSAYRAAQVSKPK